MNFEQIFQFSVEICMEKLKFSIKMPIFLEICLDKLKFSFKNATFFDENFLEKFNLTSIFLIHSSIFKSKIGTPYGRLPPPVPHALAFINLHGPNLFSYSSCRSGLNENVDLKRMLNLFTMHGLRWDAAPRKLEKF